MNRLTFADRKTMAAAVRLCITSDIVQTESLALQYSTIKQNNTSDYYSVLQLFLMEVGHQEELLFTGGTAMNLEKEKGCGFH